MNHSDPTTMTQPKQLNKKPIAESIGNKNSLQWAALDSAPMRSMRLETWPAATGGPKLV